MLHGMRPYGYCVVEKDGRRTLEIHEPEARIVRMIYEWYAGDEPESIRQITLKLTQMGIPTPSQSMYANADRTTSNHWNSAEVGKILSRELYAGRWHYAKTKTENGQRTRVSEDQTLAVEVPAIVSRDLWKRVRRRRAQNKHRPRRKIKYDFSCAGG